ncbi:hypothetical protein KFE25_012286 [Diacronema lutheri]|uniref:Uncharacterized protein n=2 Tax=Diacronema lutheri TaxID=2081491 RepID=A0A8J5XIA1_DIALT|nr:hypothetical protein KFE25_012286 [Diacronema lutheri]
MKLGKRLGELRDTLSDRLGIAKKRTSPRKGRATPRKVTFGAVKVTEFERLLCGGGGVPDGDVVSLGLGREVRSYETAPRDRPRTADKDTYCVRGCLDVRKRAQLLCEWMRKRDYLTQLRKLVKPQLLRVQRGREASNAVPAHCRDMPTSLAEAVAVARADEAAAVRALLHAAARAAAASPPDAANAEGDGGEAEGGARARRRSPLVPQRHLTRQPIRSPKRARTAHGDAAADGESGHALPDEEEEVKEGEEEEADDADGVENEPEAEPAAPAAGTLTAVAHARTGTASAARAHERAARLTAASGGAVVASGLQLWGSRVVGQRFVPAAANGGGATAAGRADAGGGALRDISRWLVWRDF